MSKNYLTFSSLELTNSLSRQNINEFINSNCTNENENEDKDSSFSHSLEPSISEGQCHRGKNMRISSRMFSLGRNFRMEKGYKYSS